VRLVEEVYYNGAREKIGRLGLSNLLNQLKGALAATSLRVLEEKDSNGGAAVRKLIDAALDGIGGWDKTTTGDIDWRKCASSAGTTICLGVEVQVSARSDLLIMDIIHLRKAINAGAIDLGVLVVPSDHLSSFLTDRAPSMSDAKRHVAEARADDLPLLLLAIEHDGPGPALAKQKKRHP